MEGTIAFQVSLVNVGDAHDNFRAKEAMGSVEGGEGGTRIKDGGAHHHGGGCWEAATATCR